MAPDKLLAEWFWTDRWMGSSAFLLPIEARGLYREMLTQAWRRGAQLPNDHEAIRRAIGATPQEWRRCWPKIEKYWRVEGNVLINDTQIDVYEACTSLQSVRQTAGRIGGLKTQANRQAKRQANNQAQSPPNGQSKVNPPDPDPDPDPTPDPTVRTTRVQPEPSVFAGTLPRDHLRHSWCSSRGKCVPDFLHAEFCAAVGGEGASQRLKAFYEAVERGWPEGPIGDDPVKLWRKEFAAKFPSVAPTPTVHQVGKRSVVPAHERL